MAVARRTLDQLPAEIPRNPVVADALDRGVTPAEILYARSADLCLYSYAVHRAGHDHADTMTAFATGSDERLWAVADCERCAGLEALEERYCRRNDASDQVGDASGAGEQDDDVPADRPAAG